MIYDEETDQLKHISFSQALYACGLDVGALNIALGWTADRAKIAATIENLTAPPLNGVPGVVNYRSKVKATLAGTSGVAADDASIQNILDDVAAGVWLPLCITIARPFIEHLMMSCVACVSGRDTGATLFGPAGKRLHTHIHTYICYGLPRFRFEALTCLCPLLSCLQTCRSARTRRSRRSRVSNPTAANNAQFTYSPM
tara:strand:+ start:3725 stop:4321 length:597 start_codon:yes stop_codon:yes gene_type:complete